MRIYRKAIEAELLLMVKIDEKESGGSEKSERKKPFLRFIGFGKHSTIFHVLSFTRSLSLCMCINAQFCADDDYRDEKLMFIQSL